eukprot:gene30662-37051_t
MSIKVQEYIREDASIPYKQWFDSLSAQAAAKVTVAKLRMELGNTSSIKWFDGMGEYVIDWGPGYRIYLAKDGDTLIVLFGGGTKRGQQRDIDKAKELLSEYKARKKAIHANTSSKHKRNFKDTVVERVQSDASFAQALLDEAATLFLNGEPETARLILRDLVNATMGFEQLAALTAKPSKSLHRMLSPKGNPSMDNLAAIFRAVRERLQVSLSAHSIAA